MSRIIKLISCLAMCTVAFSCFAACKDNKTDTNSTSSDTGVSTSSVVGEVSSTPDPTLTEYFNTLVKEYGKTDTTLQNADKSNTAGMTGGIVCDLDGNGNDEMITARSTGLKNTEFALEIYSARDNEVSKLCVITDGSTEYSNTFANNDVYLKKVGDKYYICSKVYYATDVSGIPCSQTFSVYEYDNGNVMTVCKLSCVENSTEEKELSIHNEVVYKSNMYGTADENYQYTSLSDVIDAFWAELRPFSLDNKIYGERSGNEIIAITFEGCNPGNDEIPFGYRKEVTSQNSLQVQFTNYFPH